MKEEEKQLISLLHIFSSKAEAFGRNHPDYLEIEN